MGNWFPVTFRQASITPKFKQLVYEFPKRAALLYAVGDTTEQVIENAHAMANRWRRMYSSVRDPIKKLLLLAKKQWNFSCAGVSQNPGPGPDPDPDPDPDPNPNPNPNFIIVLFCLALLTLQPRLNYRPSTVCRWLVCSLVVGQTMTAQNTGLLVQSPPSSAGKVLASGLRGVGSNPHWGLGCRCSMCACCIKRTNPNPNPNPNSHLNKPRF